MILLPTGHRSLGEHVKDLVEWEPDVNAETEEGEKKQTRQPCKIELCDFDNVAYQVRLQRSDPDSMTVSVNIPFLDDVKSHGLGQCLQSEFGTLLSDEVVDGFNVSLKIRFSDFKTAEEKASIIKKIECVKSSLVGSVFRFFVDAASENKVPEVFKFDLRADTQVYFVPRQGGLAVIFGLQFAERFDKVLAKVFLQEFQEARRRIGAAPAVSFDVNPKSELAAFGITEATGNLGFISFALLPSHFNTPAKRAQVVETLQMFRTYLQYHIKCSKSYFHSRMRKGCAELLKVLNRAKVKPVVSNSTAVKVQITGRGKGI